MGHKLPLEDQFRFQTLRIQVQQTQSLPDLQKMALQLVDLMEQQKAVTLLMLRQDFLKLPPCEDDRQPH